MTPTKTWGFDMKPEPKKRSKRKRDFSSPFGREFLQAWAKSFDREMMYGVPDLYFMESADCTPRKRRTRVPKLTPSEKFDVDVLLFDCECVVKKGDRR